MKRLLVAILVILFVSSITSCNKTASEKGSSTGSYKASEEKIVPVSPADFIHEGFYQFGGYSDGKDNVNLIKSNLGQPIKEVKKEARFENETYLNYTYELYYEGLYIYVYHAAYDGREFIMDINIKNPKYRFMGLGVGDSKERVTKTLGPPVNLEQSDSLSYGSYSGLSGVKFTLKDGNVSEIEWYSTFP